MLDYRQSNSLLTRPGLSDSGRLGCSELFPEQLSEDVKQDEANITIAGFRSDGKAGWQRTRRSLPWPEAN
jgi:hypothetical protein